MQSFFRCWLFWAAVALTVGPLQAAEPAAMWVAAWAAAARNHDQPPAFAGMGARANASLRDQTVRLRVLPAVGGNEARVRFSNVFGKVPLQISAASVARSTGAEALSPGTAQPLRFDGRPEVTIAPGAERWSDAVRLAIQPQQPVAVSFHLANATATATVFQASDATAWIATGDATGSATLPMSVRSDWGHVVTGIDVSRRPPPAVVVAFGDSITQGSGTGDSLEGGYPARLAQRLRGPSVRSDAPSVVNVGIGGNRLLADGIGPRALDRFERDVLQQSGVTHTLILIGVNDIGREAVLASEALTVGSVTAGLQRLTDSARKRGVKVLLGTLTPFKGSAYFNEATELKRQAINRWIRGRQDVDGVIDFDAALRDPDDLQSLKSAYDSGDHLHPSGAGYAAMAAAIDVRELQE